MELVKTIDEIVENLVRFDRYRTSDHDYFAERLKLGRNFVYGVIDSKHLFCPSRFVGYAKCTAEKHIAFGEKNGSATTPRISRLLGEHVQNKFAEEKFMELCRQQGIAPAKLNRTFWSVGSTVSAPKEVLSGGEMGFPDETNEYLEGATKKVFVNSYERNHRAREACIKQYGVKCVVCKFDFQAKYGAIGKGFIHIHHLKPIAKQSGKYVVNPETDLRPVCPNCHAMLHISDPPLSIDELIEIVSVKP